MTNSEAVDHVGGLDGEAVRLVQGCEQCVSQCDQLLQLLTQEDYASDPEASSSIGAHMRHIIDRFQCFFAGLPDIGIDYDSRKRDKAIETNLDTATLALASLAKRLEAMECAGLDQVLVVNETVHQDEPSVQMPSTVGRELMGLITHTIHHLALIGLIAKSLGIQLDDDFGKAPSTIVYERS